MCVCGGGVNLIRSENDKSSGNGNTRLINAFNNFLADLELRELRKVGGKYT